MLESEGQSFPEKLKRCHWRLCLVVCLLGAMGFVMLFSAAEGQIYPWALQHLTRFFVGLGLLLFVALVDLRRWLTLAYPAYGVGLLLLLFVALAGDTGEGPQRWIDLGAVRFQPSEAMKILLPLALACYFHRRDLTQVRRLRTLFPAVCLVIIPVLLVLRQPDLGTALLLLMGGGCVFFFAGVPWKYFGAVFVGAVAALPVLWGSLYEYQRARIFAFLDPERDPLGQGYHIIQSEIALGAGGLTGRGLVRGSQGQLHFLPEKHTDFIFTLLGEELGFRGTALLLALYVILLFMGMRIAHRSRNHFGRLLAVGICAMVFLCVCVNIAMVMGLVPVVGIPLPFVSYGGSSLITLMGGLGLVMCVHVHRRMEISRTLGTFW